jgi:eukaryotic-like serine/threonine-protein kinase
MARLNDTFVAESSRDPYVGKVLAGRYRVVEPLGSGGMGVVYRAEHVHMRKLVALKILHQHMTLVPEVVARFEREAVAAGRIEHANVAAALDFGRLEDGSFYLALEYVEGKSLGDLLEVGPLPTPRALIIARQIADGLAAAHAAGIVHRDLKPDNVLLVEREDFRDCVKMLDFGIAKVHMEEGSGHKPLTQIGTIFGTPQYMSPEQGQGHAVDARSDLYALGVILYEMLSGKLPFRADDLIVLITRHITEPPPALSEAIPAAVRELTFELLAKKPEDRVQTAAELVRRLDRLLADGSIAPPGTLPPSGFPARRMASTEPAPGRAEGSLLSISLVRARSFGRELVRRVPWLERRVRVGRFDLPVVGLAAAGAGLFLLGVLVAVLVASPGATATRDGSEPPNAAASSAASQRDSERARHERLVAKAAAGDAQALAALEAVPSKQRSADDARALGRGRCAAGDLPACMEGYRAAVLAFPRLGREPALLADVRRAMDDERSSEAAFRFAAHQLRAGGLDAIYDFWIAQRGKQEQAVVARRTRARAFLDDSSVRENATRELALVFDLERAESRKRCGDAKAALTKAREYGDERLSPLLERLSSTRGCGFMGLGDCWSCLRAGKELTEVRAAVKDRRAPSFTGG